ncbi:hypothetical protein SK128_005702, partial [Halocaridina rubra]
MYSCSPHSTAHGTPVNVNSGRSKFVVNENIESEIIYSANSFTYPTPTHMPKPLITRKTGGAFFSKMNKFKLTPAFDEKRKEKLLDLNEVLLTYSDNNLNSPESSVSSVPCNSSIFSKRIKKYFPKTESPLKFIKTSQDSSEDVSGTTETVKTGTVMDPLKRDKYQYVINNQKGDLIDKNIILNKNTEEESCCVTSSSLPVDHSGTQEKESYVNRYQCETQKSSTVLFHNNLSAGQDTRSKKHKDVVSKILYSKSNFFHKSLHDGVPNNIHPSEKKESYLVCSAVYKSDLEVREQSNIEENNVKYDQNCTLSIHSHGHSDGKMEVLFGYPSDKMVFREYDDCSEVEVLQVIDSNKKGFLWHGTTSNDCNSFIVPLTKNDEHHSENHSLLNKAALQPSEQQLPVNEKGHSEKYALLIEADLQPSERLLPVNHKGHGEKNSLLKETDCQSSEQHLSVSDRGHSEKHLLLKEADQPSDQLLTVNDKGHRENYSLVKETDPLSSEQQLLVNDKGHSEKPSLLKGADLQSSELHLPVNNRGHSENHSLLKKADLQPSEQVLPVNDKGQSEKHSLVKEADLQHLEQLHPVDDKGHSEKYSLLKETDLQYSEQQFAVSNINTCFKSKYIVKPPLKKYSEKIAVEYFTRSKKFSEQRNLRGKKSIVFSSQSLTRREEYIRNWKNRKNSSHYFLWKNSYINSGCKLSSKKVDSVYRDQVMPKSKTRKPSAKMLSSKVKERVSRAQVIPGRRIRNLSAKTPLQNRKVSSKTTKDLACSCKANLNIAGKSRRGSKMKAPSGKVLMLLNQTNKNQSDAVWVLTPNRDCFSSCKSVSSYDFKSPIPSYSKEARAYCKKLQRKGRELVIYLPYDMYKKRESANQSPEYCPVCY